MRFRCRPQERTQCCCCTMLDSELHYFGDSVSVAVDCLTPSSYAVQAVRLLPKRLHHRLLRHSDDQLEGFCSWYWSHIGVLAFGGLGKQSCLRYPRGTHGVISMVFASKCSEADKAWKHVGTVSESRQYKGGTIFWAHKAHKNCGTGIGVCGIIPVPEGDRI